jgi:hypothetical protein
VLLGSVAVHGVVFAVIRLEWDAWIPAAPETTTPHVELIDITPVPPVPPKLDTIEVAFISDTPAAPPSRTRGVPTHAIVAAAGAEMISSGAASEPPGTTSDAPKKSLGMRGPELHPADDQLAHIADAPGHEPPSAPIPSKRVEAAPGGRAVIDDEVATIEVDKDGTAHVHNKPDLDVTIDVNPIHIWRGIKGFGASIADWAQDPDAGKNFGKTQDLSQANQAVQGNCDQYGSSLCDDVNAPDAEKSSRKQNGGGGLSILSGKFDETSYLMRKFGVGDAFSSRKLKALDDTRLERAERGAKYKQQQLDHSAQLMQDNLERVWAGTQNLDERKAVLFELWDECAEGEGPIGEAGERARKMVIGWIRAKLPDGKAGAFTAAEITALDKHRTSHQPFAPY